MHRLPSDLQQQQARHGPKGKVPVRIGEEFLRCHRFRCVVLAGARLRNDLSRRRDDLPWQPQGSAIGITLRPGPGITFCFFNRKRCCRGAHRIAIEQCGHA